MQQQQAEQGRVASQVQRLNQGQPLLPTDDDNDRPTRRTEDQDKPTTEEMYKTNEQTIYETMRTSIGAGKKPLPEYDPLPDAWQSESIKQQIELMLKTKEAKVLQLEAELRRMQKTIDDLQYKTDPQPTPISQQK